MGTQIRVRDNYEHLTGPEKAAVILLSLGKEKGAKVMEKFDDDEIRIVSRAMASLGSITSEIAEQLLRQFTDHFANSATVIGTYESTERMLSNFLEDDRVMEIMSEIRGPAGRTMWEKVSNVNEQVLATYLQGEHPQTAAVILSKIRSSHTAKVLPLLPKAFVHDVVRRMIEMEYVQKDILEDVEEMLHSEFMANYIRAHGSDSHMHMADILNMVDRDSLKEIMGGLEEDMPDSATVIKALMFTFDDLVKLDPRTLQVIIQNAEVEVIVTALKGVRDEVRDIFFANFSERAGLIVRSELENMGPVRADEVEDAQNKILSLAKELSDRGEIYLTQGPNSTAQMIL
ncbi:flagellar motor switch protein FliG [Rhodospirillaceae bacterium SYSU D60014]|uniref:flagellar motor switch protein FliG n=1 Tax=Virgifigura deserti TaxID=2268457 RepID=UPI000E67622E